MTLAGSRNPKELQTQVAQTVRCVVRAAPRAVVAVMPASNIPLDSSLFSICPGCGARLPVLIEAPPARLAVARGRIAGAGCAVDVSARGLFTKLRIETPSAVWYRGPEPGQWLSTKGATLLLAGPWVVAALVLALDLRPFPVVVLLLLVALAGAWAARVYWRPPADLPTRTLRYAWTLLAPCLHHPRFTVDESAFVAGLALHTMETDLKAVPWETFDRFLALTEQAVLEGQRVVRHLAALHHLGMSRATTSGDDLVSLMAVQVGRCFDARMPCDYAEELLAKPQEGDWNKGSLARLRLLVCDRAFEAGFEVRHLLEAGQLVPNLGALLQTDDAAGLARLRLLWSLRASRPWDRCSSATTAFELAAQPESGRILSRYPDLLFHQSLPVARPRPGEREEDMEQGELILCGRGIVFEDVLFTAEPSKLEVFSRGVFRRRGHKLMIGAHTFYLPDDPQPLSDLLGRWFEYFFREFRPMAADVDGWQSRAGDTVLRTWGTVACSQCRRIIRTKPGEVGVTLEEPAGTPAQ